MATSSGESPHLDLRWRPVRLVHDLPVRVGGKAIVRIGSEILLALGKQSLRLGPVDNALDNRYTGAPDCLDCLRGDRFRRNIVELDDGNDLRRRQRPPNPRLRYRTGTVLPACARDL